MTILLSIAIFQALFLVLLLFKKKTKKSSDKLLATLLLFMAMLQGFFLIIFSGIGNIPRWILLLGAGFPLLFRLLLFFYVSALIRQ